MNKAQNHWSVFATFFINGLKENCNTTISKKILNKCFFILKKTINIIKNDIIKVIKIKFCIKLTKKLFFLTNKQLIIIFYT